MVELSPQSGLIPHVEPSPLSAPFWAGCADGELRFQRCARCGRAQFPPAPNCRNCLHDTVGWEVSAGLGSVYSWTVVWRPASPVFGTPYAPAIVDVDEGYQLVTDIVGLDTGQLRIGQRVEVVFQALADGFTLPYFRPHAG
jgi:uncharacterized protein